MESAPHCSKFDDKTFDIIGTEKAIAEKKGRSIPQVAHRQKDVVTSVIIGAKTLTQLDDNMAAGNGWSLTKEEMKQLNDVSAPTQGYHYGMINDLNADRLNLAANSYNIMSVSE